MVSPILIILLVLLAAVLHAAWNALVKIGGDRKLMTALVALMSGLVCLPLLFFVVPPDPASWPFILGSVVIHIGYYYGLSEMYETGDFSLVYPLARGLSPLLVAIVASATAGEILDVWQMLGVTLVSLGIASLAFGRGWPRGDHARSILFAGFTCLTIAAYSVTDGFGVRHAGSSLGYIAWLFVIDAFPFPLIMALQRGPARCAYVERNGRPVWVRRPCRRWPMASSSGPWTIRPWPGWSACARAASSSPPPSAPSSWANPSAAGASPRRSR